MKVDGAKIVGSGTALQFKERKATQYALVLKENNEKPSTSEQFCLLILVSVPLSLCLYYHTYLYQNMTYVI